MYYNIIHTEFFVWQEKMGETTDENRELKPNVRPPPPPPPPMSAGHATRASKELEPNVSPPPPPVRIGQTTGSTAQSASSPPSSREFQDSDPFSWRMFQVPPRNCPVVGELLTEAMAEYDRNAHLRGGAGYMSIAGYVTKTEGDVSLLASYRGRGLKIPATETGFGRHQFFIEVSEGGKPQTFKTPQDLEKFLGDRGIGKGNVRH